MKRASPDHFASPQLYMLDPNNGKYELLGDTYDRMASNNSVNSSSSRNLRKFSTRKQQRKRNRQCSFLYEHPNFNKYSLVHSANYPEYLYDSPPSNIITQENPRKQVSQSKRRKTMSKPMDVFDIYDGPLYEVDLKRLEIITNLQRLRGSDGYDDHEEALVWTDSECDFDGNEIDDESGDDIFINNSDYLGSGYYHSGDK